MCLLLTFQMHPSLRRRMLALLTKRTKQSTLFECNEERSATAKATLYYASSGEFECNEERSATILLLLINLYASRLNAMKSGVQLEGVCLSL